MQADAVVRKAAQAQLAKSAVVPLSTVRRGEHLLQIEVSEPQLDALRGGHTPLYLSERIAPADTLLVRVPGPLSANHQRFLAQVAAIDRYTGGTEVAYLVHISVLVSDPNQIVTLRASPPSEEREAPLGNCDTQIVTGGTRRPIRIEELSTAHALGRVAPGDAWTGPGMFCCTFDGRRHFLPSELAVDAEGRTHLSFLRHRRPEVLRVIAALIASDRNIRLEPD